MDILLLQEQNGGGGSFKWKTLEHMGPLFPADYIPHGKPLKYKDQLIELTKEQEETAMLYAKYITTEYIENKTFNKNFWNDWKKILGKKSKIQSLEDCDFTEYKKIIDDEKDIAKNIYDPNVVKQTIKAEIDETIKAEIDETIKVNHINGETIKDDDVNISRVVYNITPTEEEKYKVATVDGNVQPVGNYRMEPPGIFLGRGSNPNIGKVKRRIYPEDVRINIGKEAKIPPTLPGHKWGKIIHDRHVEWLASWKDIITGKTKYLWLGASSHFKSSSDQEKFDLAKKLKRKIEIIRTENYINLLSDNKKTRQIATAFYFIDSFALRVGGEKGEDTADTVGVTTLRVEHIILTDSNTIVLDFLGKDSVRFYNKLQVDPQVYTNIEEFVKDKNKGEDIFDLISSQDVNKYLQTFMKDLTAKVFRTFNASYLFQKEIHKINKKYESQIDTIDQSVLIDEYLKANTSVAKKLNHQKNVGKSFKDVDEKFMVKIKKIKVQIQKSKKSSSKKGSNKEARILKLKDKLKKIKLKYDLKKEMKNISLGTSKENYIDPRITMVFIKKYNIPLEKVFSTALIKKFVWALTYIEENPEFKF
jgi:DNA topoisomerase-1